MFKLILFSILLSLSVSLHAKTSDVEIILAYIDANPHYVANLTPKPISKPVEHNPYFKNGKFQHKKVTRATQYHYRVPFKRSRLERKAILKFVETEFQAYGLPKGLATIMLKTESQVGQQMVSSTNAKGWYQFTSKTAAAYGLSKPFDLLASTDAAIKLSLDNRRDLLHLGISPTIANIYAAHVIGPGNTNTVVSYNQGEVVTGKQVKHAMFAIKSNWHRSTMGKRSYDRGDLSRFHRGFKAMVKRKSNGL